MERLPRRVEAVRAAKRGNSILMPLVLEWDVQQAHIGVMVRCPYTFGHIVYIDVVRHLSL